MRTDVFFDSNVLLYLASSDPKRAGRSEALLADGGLISAQVLNEVANVLRKKWKWDWPEANEFLNGIRANTTVVPITEVTHTRGLAYAERYRFGIFDSMVLAAAEIAGCATLYSEDMQHGQVIEGVTIVNPYR